MYFETSLGPKQGRLARKGETISARQEGNNVKPHKTNLHESTDKNKKRKQMNFESKSKDEKSTATKGKTTRRKRIAIREYPQFSCPRLSECGLLGDIVRKMARFELTSLVKRFEQDKDIRPCLVAIIEAAKKFEAKSQKLDKLGVMINDVRAQMQGKREKMAVLKDLVELLEAEDLAWDEAEKAIASGDMSKFDGPASLPQNTVDDGAKEQQGEVAGSGEVEQCLNELNDVVSSCGAMAGCFSSKLLKRASLIDQAQEVQSQLYDVYERLKFKDYPNIDDPKSAIAAIAKE